MDRPWKAVVVVVLIIVCGASYLIWTERARIADAILTSAHVRAMLNEQEFLADAPQLLRVTRADYALLVELDLNDNIMEDRVGIDVDGNRWVTSTGPQEALKPTSSMALLVRFLNNDLICTDTSVGVSNEDALVLGQKGYVRTCMIAVPPILGVGVGGLLLAWKTRPLPAAEVKAGYAMKAAALKFATW